MAKIKYNREYEVKSILKKLWGRNPSEAELKSWLREDWSIDEFEREIAKTPEAAEYAVRAKKEAEDKLIADQAALEQKKIDQAKAETEGATKAERDRIASDIAGLITNIKNQREQYIGETQKTGEEFIGQTKERLSGRMSALDELLRGREERLFSEAAPDILESLSGRGLLHSSGVGTELAKEKGRLAAASEETLKAQSLSDVDVEQKLAQQIQDRIFGIRGAGLEFESSLGGYGVQSAADLGKLSLQELSDLRRAGITSGAELGRAKLERGFSIEDRDYAAELAKEIARINADASRESNTADLLGNLAGVALPLIFA